MTNMLKLAATAIPEPSTLALVGLGGLTVLLKALKRRASGGGLNEVDPGK